MSRKAGMYIREMDGKICKFLGFTNSRNSVKRGKNHVGKVIVDNEYANLFKSSSGYYIADMEGEMLHDMVAVLSVVKGKSEIFFVIPTEDFYSQYNKQVVA